MQVILAGNLSQLMVVIHLKINNGLDIIYFIFSIIKNCIKKYEKTYPYNNPLL